MDNVYAPIRFSPTLFAFWFALSLTLGAVGPFGTYDLLDFPARLGYWTAIASLSIALEYAKQRLFPYRTFVQRIVWRLGFVVILSLVINLINAALFDSWNGPYQVLVAFGYVAAVAVFIEAVLAILGLEQFRFPALADSAVAPVRQELEPHPAIQSLLAKLPEARRGALHHIEAQGHYLTIATSRGEAKILMRLSDAMNGLPSGLGVQTHRSHWIAFAAVQKLERHSARLYARLVTGKLVPVSRGREESVCDFLQGEGMVAAAMGKMG